MAVPVCGMQYCKCFCEMEGQVVILFGIFTEMMCCLCFCSLPLKVVMMMMTDDLMFAGMSHDCIELASRVTGLSFEFRSLAIVYNESLDKHKAAQFIKSKFPSTLLKLILSYISWAWLPLTVLLA
jgi:hypothetical protein